MPDTSYYMHQSLAQAVWDHDIDVIFGLMGDANLFFGNHFVKGCGGKLVPAAHEGGTVLMAQAYSKVTGNVTSLPPVCSNACRQPSDTSPESCA